MTRTSTGLTDPSCLPHGRRGLKSGYKAVGVVGMKSRLPHGRRGLKFELVDRHLIKGLAVASRMGGDGD